jgi:hypothetical protein
VWDLDGAANLLDISCHKIFLAVFSGDDTKVISQHFGVSILLVWDAITGSRLSSLLVNCLSSYALNIVSSANGNYCGAVFGWLVQVWDIEQAVSLPALSEDLPVDDICFDVDGTLMFAWLPYAYRLVRWVIATNTITAVINADCQLFDAVPCALFVGVNTFTVASADLSGMVCLYREFSKSTSQALGICVFSGLQNRLYERKHVAILM